MRGVARGEAWNWNFEDRRVTAMSGTLNGKRIKGPTGGMADALRNGRGKCMKIGAAVANALGNGRGRGEDVHRCVGEELSLTNKKGSSTSSVGPCRANQNAAAASAQREGSLMS